MDLQPSFLNQCQIYLDEKWGGIMSNSEAPHNPLLTEEIKQAIKETLLSKTKTYRYILPTQLLAKCVEQRIDCRSVQASFQSPGAFDARSLADAVIVPFDKNHHNVLGGSTEPYVNNPLRVQAIIKEYRAAQKNKSGWDIIVDLLATVEARDDILFTRQLFSQVLYEIHALLAGVTVTYPVPNRIGLGETLDLVSNFIEEKSGGDRLESVVKAYFEIIKKKYCIFDEVRRSKVNASDSSTGFVGDIECVKDKRIVKVVEVKDKPLTLSDFNSLIGRARAARVKEIFFIAQRGVVRVDEKAIRARVRQEFNSGQNIYILESFDLFSSGTLAILGENGRSEFLAEVGIELDRIGSSIHHKRKWAELLGQA